LLRYAWLRMKLRHNCDKPISRKSGQRGKNGGAGLWG